jgi:hypothetical protein
MTTERPTDAEVIGELERHEAKTGDRTSALGREVVRARDSEEWFRQQWLKEQAFRAEIETQKDAEIARLRAAFRPFEAYARVFVGRADRGGHKDDAPIAGANDAVLTVGDCRAAIKALEGE